MTPWEQLDAATSGAEVAASAARVLELNGIDHALFLRKAREKRQKLAIEAAGLLDLDWACDSCHGSVRVVGQRDGRELGCCEMCSKRSSREK